MFLFKEGKSGRKQKDLKQKKRAERKGKGKEPSKKSNQKKTFFLEGGCVTE